MTCTECEDKPGKPTRVEFTDGTETKVELCEECRDRFTEGDLIMDIEAVSAE